MADLDPSIYSQIGQGVTPLQSPLDAMTKVMAFKSLANRNQIEGLQAQQAQQEYDDNQAIKLATNNNTTVNPDNTISVDKKSVVKDLAAGSNPSLALKQQQQYAQNDIAMNDAQMAGHIKALDFGNRVMSGVTDQSSYDAATKIAQAHGFDTSHFPAQYDKDWVDNQVTAGLDTKSKIEKQQKDQQIAIEQQKAKIDSAKLGVDMFKTYGNPSAGQGPSGKQASNAQIDPSTLVSKAVPPDRQKQVFDEIEAAQNTAKSAPQILAAFDRAAQNRHMADFIPGIDNADQKAMHALMGPTFKDVEGTVRQAAMDNMAHNTTPQALDDANTIATKRASLVGYLTSKSAAPTSKGFGIDLSKYPSTTLSFDDHPQDEQALKWAKANPKDARAAQILKANGVSSVAEK